MIDIRKMRPEDEDGIWEIIHEVIAGGDSYAFDPSSTREEMLEFWRGPGKYTYVATRDKKILGSFVLRNNQPGLGSHIANGAYIVTSAASGQGIGKAMGLRSIEEAKRIGYRAMQFNFVVASNTRAVKLWLGLGFEIVGEVPEAFNHSQNGLTNIYILYRKL